MSFHFTCLDARTRQLMLEEFLRDESRGDLYLGKYTNSQGKAAFGGLLKKAIESGDEVTLAQSLHSNLFLERYEKKTPKGGTTMAKVPHNANEVLAEGEFNRFYIRAICRLAEERDISAVKIYRAKQVHNPRPESEARIGHFVVTQSLLNDLRSSQGVETALGCPPGPCSGLSIRIADEGPDMRAEAVLRAAKYSPEIAEIPDP